MKKSAWLITAALAVVPISCAQNSAQTEAPIEVVFLEADQDAPAAALSQISWMSGRWQSEATPTSFSGGGEHVILEARDGQMPGLVRVMTREGGYMLFELSSFMEVDGTLTYRNRHFAPDLVAWQPPEEFVDRRLVAIDDNAAYFDGITFVNRGPTEMGVAFVLTGDDGAQTKYTVDYVKVPLN